MNALDVCSCTFCENVIFQKRLLPQVAFSGEGGWWRPSHANQMSPGGAPTDGTAQDSHFELKQQSVLATSKATQTSLMSTTQQIWAPKICLDLNGSTLTTSAKKIWRALNSQHCNCICLMWSYSGKGGIYYDIVYISLSWTTIFHLFEKGKWFKRQTRQSNNFSISNWEFDIVAFGRIWNVWLKNQAATVVKTKLKR